MPPTGSEAKGSEACRQDSAACRQKGSLPAMGQPAKVDVEAPVPLKRSPTLRTRDTVGLRDALLARKAKKLQATRLGFLCLYVTILFGVWILALRHNRISLYELEYSPSRPVWKSKCHGAFTHWLIYAQVTAARRRAQGLRLGGQARA